MPLPAQSSGYSAEIPAKPAWPPQGMLALLKLAGGNVMDSMQTAPTAQCLSVAPYFLVRDVVATANWYHLNLGFSHGEFHGDPPAFVIVERDNVSIMLRQPSEDDGPVPPHSNRARLGHSWDCYIYVRDVDELFEELSANSAPIIRSPESTEYGCRELEVEDPNGYVLCFGQILEQ
jgi:uncharacterized glyoxalase superfamily protein PhnB